MSRRIVERVVWSPENGGCLMVQERRAGGPWIDRDSFEEGQYPKHDASAKAAVRIANVWRRARAAKERANAAYSRYALLDHRAREICRKGGVDPAAIGLSGAR